MLAKWPKFIHQLFVYTRWGQSIFEVLFDFFYNTFRWLQKIFSWSFVCKLLNLIKSWKLKCNFKKTFSPLCYILTWKANILCMFWSAAMFLPHCAKLARDKITISTIFFFHFWKLLFLFFFSQITIKLVERD